MGKNPFIQFLLYYYRSRSCEQKRQKHMLQVNYSVAYDACHYLLRLHGGEESPKIESLIEKNFLPIRPNRKYARQHRFRVPVSFLYRYA